jgi:pyridoxal phosphate enzyme (YggS family)
MPDVDAILRRNLAAVQDRLAAACRRAGRDRAAVTLVAVTKYVDAAIAGRLHQLGVMELAESKPQELWRKAAAVPAAAWHLVGHLQRNKVEKTLPLVRLIHSVDSARLLAAIDAAAARLGRPAEVLLEINLSGEAAKTGLPPGDLDPLLEQVPALKHVRVRGLMTMGPLADDPEAARPVFRGLRELRDRLRPRLGPEHDLAHLSMGMTDDCEVAIEEGATLVRIGSALFHGLEGGG